MYKVWTIGHSTHTPERFIEMLKNNDIEVLVDIRSYPGSRRCPHFNKENMSVWLPEVGIDYVHMSKLGGRRNKIKTVDYNLVNGWRHPSFANYAAYTLTDEFKEGLRELTQLIKNNKIAYMCSELCHKQCHRNLVSNTLTVRGFKVVHIEPKKSYCHEVSTFLKIKDNEIIYPRDQLSFGDFIEGW